ncbi:MAG: DUF2283 domain-containing protein [Candidatus Sericytochromatia bacterium]
MRFYYDSRTDKLGIRFKPGKAETPARRQEVMPGVLMDFDSRGNLIQLEIMRASAQQPELPHFVEELARELAQRSGELAQEALLAIEKTLRLGDDDKSPAELRQDYAPCFSFDAISNVLVAEFLRPDPSVPMMPKKQISPEVAANFNEGGYLVNMEIRAALQQFPDLRRFVEQGQELLAVQHLFRSPPPPPKPVKNP